MHEARTDTFPPLPAPDADWALFLDVDGTLAEFAPRPEQVVVSAGILAALAALTAAMDGAVAIVSGRPISQIDRLFAPLVLPAAGLHGLERRFAAAGPVERPVPAAWHDEIAARIKRFAGAREGVWLEDKGATLAVHYRGAAGHETAARALADEIAAEGHPGLAVQHGKMIVEFRPAGADKGHVVDAFLGHAPFAGRVPVFVGDDLTDEDGFRAARARGGHAIRVGHVTDTEADRTAPTAAEWMLPTVREAERWLADVAGRLGGAPVGGP